MKIGQLKELKIVDGHPVVIKITDYIYDELAKTGDYDLMIQGSQDLLSESKRLNDQWNNRL